jgi:4-amino-4-deoxy-L-arabinose transferase-like glycosyltransferase
MKLKFKEDPKEWRKQALLAAFGIALICSVLRWRRVLTPHVWLTVLAVCALLAVCSCLRPNWFRGYYRLSMRLGFASSRILGFVALVLFFIFILTPVGLVLRIAGKDPLQLRRPSGTETFWQSAHQPNSLDRLF